MQNDSTDVVLSYDSLRSIYTFSSGTGNAYVDSLHSHMLASSPFVQRNNICMGDFCASYQQLNPPGSDSMFYFFKGESGEYGFSNYQYLLWKDSMVYARRFEVNPMLSDSGNRYAWSITEHELRFAPNSAIGLVRTDSTTELSLYDYEMESTPALFKFRADSAYIASRQLLRELLSMEQDTTMN